MQPINTILVPTDFSPASELALAYARQLADAYGASLHLLHVIEDPFAGGEHMGMLMSVPEGYFEQLDLRSRARLTSLLSEDQRRQYRAVFATRMGHGAPEILAYVDDHGAIDLVVIASAGRGAVSRLVMGSVTDKVMRAAPCPVLLVHAHDRTESGDRTRAA